MKISISVEGTTDDRELADLYRWIARDHVLTRRNRISTAIAAPAPDEQGGALEAINAVAGNAIALSSLVVAVLAHRRNGSADSGRGTVRIERDGIVVSIEPGSEISAEEIIELLAPETPPDEDTTGGSRA
ncbi:hypothetical protein E1264_18035 [Actinomadura sp. KC216]|uniref:effector-associated constant component EACC1 n=1 Tax=Actinomadura sp. KC216 TaxID=2530370 RepID=UPI0010469FBD|nr:hypothetical protein [Actinomadura sp. KC216]TDB86404.1 hypothetical protein E1264_18035 [Actinomadura sp. KC216]